jgi:hypothetical protein
MSYVDASREIEVLIRRADGVVICAFESIEDTSLTAFTDDLTASTPSAACPSVGTLTASADIDGSPIEPDGFSVEGFAASFAGPDVPNPPLAPGFGSSASSTVDVVFSIDEAASMRLLASWTEEPKVPPENGGTTLTVFLEKDLCCATVILVDKSDLTNGQPFFVDLDAGVDYRLFARMGSGAAGGVGISEFNEGGTAVERS